MQKQKHDAALKIRFPLAIRKLLNRIAQQEGRSVGSVVREMLAYAIDQRFNGERKQ